MVTGEDDELEPDDALAPVDAVAVCADVVAPDAVLPDALVTGALADVVDAERVPRAEVVAVLADVNLVCDAITIATATNSVSASVATHRRIVRIRRRRAAIRRATETLEEAIITPVKFGTSAMDGASTPHLDDP